MRVVELTSTTLVLADRDTLHTLSLVAGALFALAGFSGAMTYGWTTEWAAVLGSVLIGGVGFGVILFRAKRRCVFDRQRVIVAVERRRLVGTRAQAFDLDTVAGVRLVRHESDDTSWYDITLAFKDAGSAVIGTCSDSSDGWGAEETLRRAIRSFGLAATDEPPAAQAT